MAPDFAASRGDGITEDETCLGDQAAVFGFSFHAGPHCPRGSLPLKRPVTVNAPMRAALRNAGKALEYLKSFRWATRGQK